MRESNGDVLSGAYKCALAKSKHVLHGRLLDTYFIYYILNIFYICVMFELFDGTYVLNK